MYFIYHSNEQLFFKYLLNKRCLYRLLTVFNNYFKMLINRYS